MRIDVPEGQHPIEYVWGDLVPGIGMAAANFSLSVYAHTTLGLREFEAARLRVDDGLWMAGGLGVTAGRRRPCGPEAASLPESGTSEVERVTEGLPAAAARRSCGTQPLRRGCVPPAGGRKAANRSVGP
ncbi:hypothetical protein SAVIM338S_06681 [Streptomyces avidinii]